MLTVAKHRPVQSHGHCWQPKGPSEHAGQHAADDVEGMPDPVLTCRAFILHSCLRSHKRDIINKKPRRLVCAEPRLRGNGQTCHQADTSSAVQVGQTGQVVAPDLYIAINSNADEPIFQARGPASPCPGCQRRGTIPTALQLQQFPYVGVQHVCQRGGTRVNVSIRSWAHGQGCLWPGADAAFACSPYRSVQML
jgi:hypothetical protein